MELLDMNSFLEDFKRELLEILPRSYKVLEVENIDNIVRGMVKTSDENSFLYFAYRKDQNTSFKLAADRVAERLVNLAK